jgi:ribonuclease VapC
MKRYVLDTSAVIALVDDRPGGEKVERLIQKARDQQAELFMSVINWGEAYQVFWREHGKAAAEEELVRLDRIPVAIIEANRELTIVASSLRVRYALPYADAFAAALALAERALLVTTDPDFERVKSEVRLYRLP